MARDPNAPPPRPAYLPPDMLARAYAEQAKATGSDVLAFRARALAANHDGEIGTGENPISASRTPSAESGRTPDSPDSRRTFAAHFRPTE